MRRYYPGYPKGLPGTAALRRELNTTDALEAVMAIFERAEARATMGAAAA